MRDSLTNDIIYEALEMCEQDGRAAYGFGTAITECPYRGKDGSASWRRGWNEACYVGQDDEGDDNNG